MCMEPTCDRDAIARGLCLSHYARRRKNGTLPPKRSRPERCCGDGCDSPDVHAKGLCNRCYLKRRKEAGYEPPPLPECVIEGCVTKQWAKGLCGTHYQHQRRAAIVDECEVQGCDKTVRADRLCLAHYHRLRRHGDPLAGGAERAKNRTCSVAGCDQGHEGLGLCRIHYRRFMNTGSLERSVPHSAFKPGNPSWNKGKGPNAGNERDQLRARTWARTVKERDDFTCQECGVRGGRLHSDHIKPWSLYPELRYDLGNGRTLCVPCHVKTPTWGSGSWTFNQEAS